MIIVISNYKVMDVHSRNIPLDYPLMICSETEAEDGTKNQSNI